MESKENQEVATQEQNTEHHARFGKALLELLDQRGWNTIPRRELTLHLLHQAHLAELLNLDDSRMRLAARLKVSPATLDGLLRDRALVCGNISQMEFQEFAGWAKRNNQTGHDDAQKGVLTFSVKSLEEAMRVEGFLDSIGVVPDYRNNRRLLVIDLSRLVAAISQLSQQSATELMLQLEDDPKERDRLRAQADGSEKKLLHQFLKAIREQGNRHIGEETVDFMISLIKKGQGWISEKRQEQKIKI
ncbi:MAG: hypothetical protein R6U27_08245 [Desulfobacterales bacterium]